MVEKFDKLGSSALLYKITVVSPSEIKSEEFNCVITSMRKDIKVH
jgi:hypothetical protein